MNAFVEEAYKYGKMVQEAHADIITLSSRQSGRRLNDRSHARRQLYFRPNYNDKSRLPAAQLAKKIWTLKRLRYRHVSGWNPVLAETDCHDEPNSPLDVPHGESLHLELELLVEAGLSNVNALRAATSLPVECFGLTDRGAIEVGKRADLVLIGSDPLQNISATRDIRHVWCGGLKFEDES